MCAFGPKTATQIWKRLLFHVRLSCPVKEGKNKTGRYKERQLKKGGYFSRVSAVPQPYLSRTSAVLTTYK
jgi:hypothetical protein